MEAARAAGRAEAEARLAPLEAHALALAHELEQARAGICCDASVCTSWGADEDVRPVQPAHPVKLGCGLGQAQCARMCAAHLAHAFLGAAWHDWLHVAGSWTANQPAKLHLLRLLFWVGGGGSSAGLTSRHAIAFMQAREAHAAALAELVHQHAAALGSLEGRLAEAQRREEEARGAERAASSGAARDVEALRAGVRELQAALAGAQVGFSHMGLAAVAWPSRGSRGGC